MGVRCLLVLGMLVFGLALSGCGSADPSARDGGGENARTVRGHGLSLEVPAGWHGDVSKADPQTASLIRAATFPLSALPAGVGQEAQRTMDDRDILISVVDYGRLPESSRLEVAQLPIGVDRSHVASFEGFREPVVTRSFVVDGHALQLWVVFGSPDPSEELFRAANKVLATLTVAPRRIELDGLSIELPDGWDGFAKDLGVYEPTPALYAANVAWPDRGANLDDPSTREGFERLPADGIVIAAAAGRHGDEAGRTLEPPIRLSDGYFHADSYEGQPAPHVSIQLISGWIGERFVSIQVNFGRNDPSDAMRAEANAVLASLALGPEPPRARGPGWREHRDERDGVTVRYPSGWRIAGEPLTPFLGEPVEILHLGTFDLRPGGSRCTHVPERALEDLGPTDAMISLYERREDSPQDFPARRRHILPYSGSEPESIACLERPEEKGFLYRLQELGDHGRRFHLYVAVGGNASLETRRETAEILDSFRFDER